METTNVFIVGCARTGTKLLRHILNGSNRISITTETHYLEHRLGGGGHHGAQLKQIGDLAVEANLERFLDYVYADHVIAPFWQWTKRTVTRSEFRVRLLETERTDRAVFSLLMRLFAEHTKESVTSDLILGEKTPAHLGYVSTLFDWFPQAKVIHTIRDPRAIASSRAKKFSKSQAGGLRKKTESLPTWLLNLSDMPVAFSRTTKSWLGAVQLHGEYERLYPQRYRLLRYEDLVTQPEKEITAICDFLGIKFEPHMLDDVVVIGSSYQAERYGSTGFDTKALERWREHLNPLFKAWFSIRARKYLKQFGYRP